MNILVIEDDERKARSLVDAVREAAPHADIQERRSYQSGLKAVTSGPPPDLVVLDMSMPTYDVSPPKEKGGRTRPFAGRDILAEINRRGIDTRVIVVTQFESFGEGNDEMTLEQLKQQLAKKHKECYVCTIFYQASESRWRVSLVDAVRSIVGAGA